MATTPSATAATLGARIEKFVEDTVTLDVITFTGQVVLTPVFAVPPGAAVGEAKATPAKFNFDELFKKVVEQMTIGDTTKLELVAYTHAEWDMDSVNFVRKDPSLTEVKLIEAHQAAVAAAQKSRFEAVKLVADLIGAAVK